MPLRRRVRTKSLTKLRNAAEKRLPSRPMLRREKTSSVFSPKRKKHSVSSIFWLTMQESTSFLRWKMVTEEHFHKHFGLLSYKSGGRCRNEDAGQGAWTAQDSS